MLSSPRRGASDLASWLLLAAMCLCFLAMQPREPLRVDAARAVLPGVGIAALAVWVMLAKGERLRAAAVAFLQMTLFTLLGVALAYAAAAGAGALRDAQLAAADRALGFDWPALRAALDGAPVLLWVFRAAYASLIAQMVVVILALAVAGRIERLRVAVCAAVLAGFVTILVAALVPAMGNLFDPAGYHHLPASIAWQERGIITGLRDGSLRVLDLSAMMGIVSFPSYHATLAAIFVWAFRGLPWGRRGTAWAALTIVATPVFGGHYAVDVLAGLLLAPASLWAAKRLVRVDASALRAASMRWAARAAPSAGIARPIRSAARR